MCAEISPFAIFSDQYGGTVDINEFKDDKYAALYQTFKMCNGIFQKFSGKSNKSGNIFHGQMGLLESFIPNAACGLVNGTHCVGMNVGLYLQIYDLANTCFSHPNFWNDFGESKSEKIGCGHQVTDIPWGFKLCNITTSALSKISKIPTKPDKFESIFTETYNTHILSTLPKSLKREAASLYMTDAMTKLIFFHEISHATNGHAEYLNQNFEILSINELGLNITNPSYSKILHLMELDADAQAMAALVTNIVLGKDFNRTPYDNANDNTVTSILSQDERLSLVLLGCFLLTWVWGTWLDLNGVHENIRETSHPHPVYRLFSFLMIPFRKELGLGDVLEKPLSMALSAVASLININKEFQPLLLIWSDNHRSSALDEIYSMTSISEALNMELDRLHYRPDDGIL